MNELLTRAPWPMENLFTTLAPRHGLTLHPDGLDHRANLCVIQHLLGMVDDDHDRAHLLLGLLGDRLPFTLALIGESFLSHLATRGPDGMPDYDKWVLDQQPVDRPWVPSGQNATG